MQRFYRSLNTQLIGLVLLMVIAFGNRMNVFAVEGSDALAQVATRLNATKPVNTGVLAMTNDDLRLTDFGISHDDALMLADLDQWNYSATRFIDSNYNEPSNIGGSGNRAVPIPAAVWLFGSGLIGLFGLARCKDRHD